jgi:hypothetical protein
MTEVIKGSDGKEFAMPWVSGIYTIVDTNHLRLEIIPNSARPDVRLGGGTISFSLSGDDLELPPVGVPIGDGGVVEKKKYRRVRK